MRTVVRGQKSDDRGQRSDLRKQRTDGRCQKTEVKLRRAENIIIVEKTENAELIKGGGGNSEVGKKI